MINKIFPLFAGMLFFLMFTFCGCGSLHDFSQRKYMPRHFSDGYIAETPREIRSKRTVFSEPVRQKQLTEKAINGLQPELYTTNSARPVKSAAFVLSDSLRQGSDKNISPKHFNKAETHKEKPDGDLERISKSAQVFGLLSLILCMVFLLSIPFGIMAIVKATRVLNDPKATPAQVNRAKTGKELGIMGIVMTFLAPFIILILLLIITSAYM